MLDAHGVVRPHWKRLLQVVNSSPSQMQQRERLIQRQIRENSVTYNVYADPQGADRLWQLDALPNIIPAAEWQTLAAGVAQRARLLNKVLADLYGEQQLLCNGLLPTELIYGHNHFLWPCRGIQPPGGVFLHTYAVDLARAPDGRWWVMADRTQSPSGAGYTLENRQILARAFPDLFRDLRVQHLSRYVDTLRDTLTQLAPCDAGETPLSVLLTPGRFNETYFEHLYLAQHLGFPLVEGHDLTVRDGNVYLKTLDGLQRVHTVLRRLDADFCDPLELRADSALGVPGLLDAARTGRVLVANALGSGVLESPGLLGFLPKISEHLLGETLMLPSVATWWCGEKPVLQQALTQLEKLVVKPAFPSQNFNEISGASLSGAELAALAQRLQERPYAYVTQEQVRLSQAPVWGDDTTGQKSIIQQAISMRVYAVATADGHYHVMPGGLTRIATDEHGTISMQRGGGSKDTWVLADGLPQGAPPRTRLLGAKELVRGSTFLPSSLAENLFWFGRYSERCESGARLLRAEIARYVNDEDTQTVDTELTENLLDNLQRMHNAGSQVRGRLSHENWRALVEIQRETRLMEDQTEEKNSEHLGDSLEQLDRLLLSLAALSGFAHDDMTRDDGWRFMMIGRRIERLQCLAGIFAECLRDKIAHRTESLQRTALDWLLEIGNSTITYRLRYLAAAQLIPVLDLLLLDTSNPHALLFQMNTLVKMTTVDTSLHTLSEQLATLDLDSLENSLFGARNTVDFLNGLADLLDNISLACSQLSDRLHLRHFAHVDDVSQQMVSS
ncbi:MAG TPA: circularly permuted type 2 ATP-grasp protein [Pseudomonadales bacterium]|nr:circularly permuted type 2 ATP-grasp protein [Pseudomonadales bacterium]